MWVEWKISHFLFSRTTFTAFEFLRVWTGYLLSRQILFFKHRHVNDFHFLHFHSSTPSFTRNRGSHERDFEQSNTNLTYFNKNYSKTYKRTSHSSQDLNFLQLIVVEWPAWRLLRGSLCIQIAHVTKQARTPKKHSYAASKNKEDEKQQKIMERWEVIFFWYDFICSVRFLYKYLMKKVVVIFHSIVSPCHLKKSVSYYS